MDQSSNTKDGQKSSDENDLSKFYEICPKAQTQMEVSEPALLTKLKNHIVVCGIHSSIMHFILPLRAKYLERQQ